MIDLTGGDQVLERAARRAAEQRIVIPTLAQMRDPGLIPTKVTERARLRGSLRHRSDQPVPHHLAQPAGRLGRRIRSGECDRVRRRHSPGSRPGSSPWSASGFPPAPTRSAPPSDASFPGSSPAASTPPGKRRCGPSTGNYCRGGAFDSRLLGCDALAILPEGMSRERFT